MPRQLYVLKGGYPWGFRLQGGDQQPLYISKVTASGKAGSAGLQVGSEVRVLNGTPADSLTLGTAHAITKTAQTLTIEIQHAQDPSTQPIQKLSTSTILTNSLDHQSYHKNPHKHHRHKSRHHQLTRPTNSSSSSAAGPPGTALPNGGVSSNSEHPAAYTTTDHNSGFCHPGAHVTFTVPPTNTVLTNTSFSSTTTSSHFYSGGASSSGGAIRPPDRICTVTHSSCSSQEAAAGVGGVRRGSGRVSQRAASTTDLLQDTDETAKEQHFCQINGSASSSSAPCSPIVVPRSQQQHIAQKHTAQQHTAQHSTAQHKTAQQHSALALSQSPPSVLTALRSTPHQTHCCFLSSSCRSCFTSDYNYHPYQNIQNIHNYLLHSNNSNNSELSLYNNKEIINKVTENNTQNCLISSESDSNSNCSSHNSSYLSSSLEFHNSDTNSKSFKESDIKNLFNEINECRGDDSSILNEVSKIESDEICNDISHRVNIIKNDLSSPSYNLDIDVELSQAPKLPDAEQVKFDEGSVTEKNKISDTCSELYEYSSSSDSSLETLVFNPYIQNSNHDINSELTENSNSDDESVDNTECEERTFCDVNNRELSPPENIECNYLENELESSDSDCEGLVVYELEEIFKKFGFLSQLEDFHYQDFRSIGRYSTIHEESGEDSEGSNTSRLSSTVIMTSSGMNQFYTTTVTHADENNGKNSTGIMDDKMDHSSKVIDEKGIGGDMAEIKEEYDIVDLDDFKNDEIVDYKSDQFSKSPHSSPTSTINSSWRTSQASTNTIESSSTAADSDDTLAKDMSELSSINSRLSTINDLSDPGFGTLDRKVSSSKKMEMLDNNKKQLKNVTEAANDVNSKLSYGSGPRLLHVDMLQSQNKQCNTIKDAIEGLESIELAAQNLLEQQIADAEKRNESVTPTNMRKDEIELPEYANISNNILSDPIQTTDSYEHDKDTEVKRNSDKESNNPTIVTVEIVGIEETKGGSKSKSAPTPPPRRKNEGKPKKKKDVTFDGFPDEKPPLPPSASPVPKVEVKKRWWSRSKETPIFISRESYNEEQIVKELERLRQSYKESDLNDFLDALEHTEVPTDIDEEFFEQLLDDLRNDLKESVNESSESLNVITEAPISPSANVTEIKFIDETEPSEPSSRSSSAARRLEKVKERMKELLKRRKKGKPNNSEQSLQNTPSRLSEDDLGRSETPLSRPLTPHSRSTTPDIKTNRAITPDSTKSDDTKKSFSISGFFKKSSPNFLRKKYNERKHRKSDTTINSESEVEDLDSINITLSSNLSKHESTSNIEVNSNLSLNAAQELKKEVRFSGEKTANSGLAKEKLTIVEIQAMPQEIVLVKETEEKDSDNVGKNIIKSFKLDEKVEVRQQRSMTQDVNNADNTASVLPLTVENLNRVEVLLPKLPERIKPPRRRKKPKNIPVPVEEITSEDIRNSYTSDQSQEVLTDTSIIASVSEDGNMKEKINEDREIIEKTEKCNQPYEKEGECPQDSVVEENLSTLTEHIDSSLNTDKSPCKIGDTSVCSLPLSSKVIPAYVAPPPPLPPLNKQENTVQISYENIDQDNELQKTPTTCDEPDTKLEHNLKSDATLDDENAESANEDLISLNTYSDITETNSTKEPSPLPFPEINENVQSFYDNDNPFEKTMAEVENEDIIDNNSDENTPKVISPIDDISTHSQVDILDSCNNDFNEDVIGKQNSCTNKNTPVILNKPSDQISGLHTLNQHIGMDVESKSINRNVAQQEALSSPGLEKHENEKSRKHGIDALTSLAEEMAHLTCEMENEPEMSYGENSLQSVTGDSVNETIAESSLVSAIHMHDSSTSDIISRIQVNNGPLSSPGNTYEVSNPSIHNIDNIISDMFNGGNAEGACNADEEIDGWLLVNRNTNGDTLHNTQTSNRSVINISNTGSYCSTRSTKYESNTYVESNSVSILKSKPDWIKSNENPIPVPPRQFLQIMPRHVVAELKTMLSVNENIPILRKAPDPLPRWDSNIKFIELVKKIPSPAEFAVNSPARAYASPGRSLTPATDTPFSTKPDLISFMPSTEAPLIDSNTVLHNVPVNCNLTIGVNDSVASNKLENAQNSAISQENVVKLFPNTQNSLVHDVNPTEYSKIIAVELNTKQKKESSVRLPQTIIIDKSTGPNYTFKVRATVYSKFESSDGWNYQKKKPPIPRRRLGCSLYLEEGYQSDSAAIKLSKRRNASNKCHSMYVDSDRGYMTKMDSSFVNIKNKEIISVSNKKNSNVNERSPPERPPPPKSIALIPTLLFMSGCDNRIPPPVPVRKSFLQLPRNRDSRKLVRNDAYIDLLSKECLNRAVDMGGQESSSTISNKLVSDSESKYREDIRSSEDKTRAKRQGKGDVNLGTSVDVGGGSVVAGGVVGGGVATAAAGLLPKVSVSSVCEAGPPPPASHSNVTHLTQLNNTCDNTSSLTQNTVAQLCDSVIYKNVPSCDAVLSGRNNSKIRSSNKSAQVNLGKAIENRDQCPFDNNVQKLPVPCISFASKLNRASRLLDELDRMDMMSPSKFNNHLPESYNISPKATPSPPPRPRTPIDERDPEQVHAEKRYQTYFLGTPRAVHKPNEEDKITAPTAQQIQATQRYSNYFLGPPRSTTPYELTSDEPDEEQLAAQKRYEGYFKKGPNRRRPMSEESDLPLFPDKEQLDAEQRYKSYFNSGPPRQKHPPSPETETASATEPDDQQRAAEKRYMSYFKSGPPRPKSQTDIDFGLEFEKQQEAERRYQKYFEGCPRSRCSSLPGTERTPSPDEEQINAEKRYRKYFTGTPRAKHSKGQEPPKQEITKEMIAAEERLNNYFLHPVPCGGPRQFINPPLTPEEIHRRKLLAEYWSVLQERIKRRSLKVVKVSKAKNEIEPENTPPTQRELVVEEFLKKVQNKKRDKDLHYGDTDSEDDEENVDKSHKRKSKSIVDDVPADLKIEGGGSLAERVAMDLGGFIGEEALQQLGLDESSLLREIETLLGVGPLTQTSATKPSISPPKGFTFNEYTKPCLHENYRSPEPTIGSSATALAKSKWMRTASGGYVKGPSQESVLEDFRESKENIVKAKPILNSNPPPRPKSPDNQITSSNQNIPTPADTVTTSSGYQTSSTQQVSSATKLLSKGHDFNQPNQFSAQYTQAQQPSSSLRSTSMPKVEQNNDVQRENLRTKTAQVPHQLWPSYSADHVSGNNQKQQLNASPVAFSSAIKAGSASPSLGRKEYKKVQYEGSTLQRRTSQENVSAAPRPEDSFAWRDRELEKRKSSLPRSQTPTITLLQKKRGEQQAGEEGIIPSRRPEYLKGDDYPLCKPSDKLYTIKREYESEDEETGTRRQFAILGHRKVDGVGPTTYDGVPTSLKTGIKSEYQGEWYRKMFDSLHKVKDDDFVTVKYKVPRVRYGSSGYMSEPDGYDSDYGISSSRYSTLDRRGRRGAPAFDWDPSDTLSRNVKRYVHQPGRIEDYIPGFSSLSEKELRANPEVEYRLEVKSQDPPRGSSNHRYNPQRMQMSHALKECGYESDSTLVFRKQSERRPENRDISELYRQIQRGGEVPIEGLRKLAPRKPKDPVIGPLPFPYLAAGGHGHSRPDSPYKYDTSEVNIHYKTPIRLEHKEHIPDEELARRQEEHMRRVYEQERRKKYLAELEDIERRRHNDNFTPLQKSSPIPLNRYDDDGPATRGSKQIARALFNFTAQNKRELSLSKGDIITVRRQIDKNWHEGELRGLVGIFPANYVEVLPADSLKSQSRKPSEGQARARFAFQAQTAMEMSFSKGEAVVLTRRVDENWYEGRVGQRRGIFPVSYVDVLLEPGDKGVSPSCSPLPRPALPSSTVLYNGVTPASATAAAYTNMSAAGSTTTTTTSVSVDTRTAYSQQLSVNTQQDAVPYRALYNYKPQNEDELELSEGDIVMVMEKCDDGWFVGTSRRTSLFGTFPGNYVEKTV